MPSIEPIPATPAGWPYLPDAALLADIPAYTQLIAAALAGMTPNPAAGPVFDTGWQAIVPATGWVAANSAAYRRIGSLIMMRGELHSGANGSTAFTMPAGLRPTSRVAVSLMRSGAAVPAAGLSIADTTGIATITGTIPAATPALNLATVSYFI